MLGAVGAYGWSGTVVHYTTQKSDIFPKTAFEKILEDRNHSSLLGKWACNHLRVNIVSFIFILCCAIVLWVNQHQAILRPLAFPTISNFLWMCIEAQTIDILIYSVTGSKTTSTGHCYRSVHNVLLGCSVQATLWRRWMMAAWSTTWLALLGPTTLDRS